MRVVRCYSWMPYLCLPDTCTGGCYGWALQAQSDYLPRCEVGEVGVLGLKFGVRFKELVGAVHAVW